MGKPGGCQIYILEVDPPEPVDGLDVEPEGKGMSHPSDCVIFR